jgi:hypothetical protein
VLPRIKRTHRGEFQVRIPQVERDVLRALPGQLRELLTGGADASDPALRRLFPPAYPDEPALSEEFEQLVRDDLVEQRVEAIDTMERTIDAERLSEDELVSWLGAINDLRLVLGTRLDVTEDTTELEVPAGDPRAQMFALYGYLSYLEEEIVGALSGR